MAIANEINILKGNIRNAYTSIQNKGGTIPTNKNTENLSSAIDSISAGGTTTLGTKTITTNGIYNASDDNLDGYSQVNVDVSEVWQRPSDWWDTKSILRNAENIELDGETYYPRYILLLHNANDTTQLVMQYIVSAGATRPKDFNVLIQTSDGVRYTAKGNVDYQWSTIHNHTWDKTKDKLCTGGYYNGTRYILVYANSLDTAMRPYFAFTDVYSKNIPTTCNIAYTVLEILYGFGSFLAPVTNAWNSGVHAYKNDILINFETFDNIDFETFDNHNYECTGTIALQHVYCPTVKYLTRSGSDGYSFTTNCYSLKYIDLPKIETTTSNITNNYALKKSITFPLLASATANLLSFPNNGSLESINLPKLQSGLSTNTSTINTVYNVFLKYINLSSYIEPVILKFTSVYGSQLEDLILANGVKPTNMDIANCTNIKRTSLLDIVNKLADVTGDTTTTHSIVIGNTNKKKLSEDEWAIATGKGWSLK